MARSKRYTKAVTAVDRTVTYSLIDAIELLKTEPVKFDAGVELHIKLGINPKKSEQIVRSTIVLPHGSGKTKRVAAFVGPDKVAEATSAGADVIGDEAVIAEIKQTGKCAFDVAVATPDMMKKLGSIAKILGQQGLMPSPKTETVGPDVSAMVTALKGGKVAYRSDDGGNVHVLVGRVSFSVEQLTENITTALDSIRRAKPAEAKGTYLQVITLASSMGPGIRVSVV